jgi:ABC-type microcin C transport system permease subunit YejB
LGTAAATSASVAAYIIRRLLLIVPTLFAIMLLNFAIVQAVPGGPIERILAELDHTAVSATERFSGGGAEFAATSAPSAGGTQTYRGATRAAIRLRQAGARALPDDDARFCGL